MYIPGDFLEGRDKGRLVVIGRFWERDAACPIWILEHRDSFAGALTQEIGIWAAIVPDSVFKLLVQAIYDIIKWSFEELKSVNGSQSGRELDADAPILLTLVQKSLIRLFIKR